MAKIYLENFSLLFSFHFNELRLRAVLCVCFFFFVALIFSCLSILMFHFRSNKICHTRFNCCHCPGKCSTNKLIGYHSIIISIYFWLFLFRFCVFYIEKFMRKILNSGFQVFSQPFIQIFFFLFVVDRNEKKNVFLFCIYCRNSKVRSLQIDLITRSFEYNSRGFLFIYSFHSLFF